MKGLCVGTGGESDAHTSHGHGQQQGINGVKHQNSLQYNIQ